MRECGTAGALVLKQFNIHLFPVRECGTAGALVLKPFNIHLFPLRECGTVVALVLHPLMPCLDLNGLPRYQSYLTKVNIFRV